MLRELGLSAQELWRPGPAGRGLCLKQLPGAVREGVEDHRRGSPGGWGGGHSSHLPGVIVPQTRSGLGGHVVQ